jgi:hypothetical protein
MARFPDISSPIEKDEKLRGICVGTSSTLKRLVCKTILDHSD